MCVPKENWNQQKTLQNLHCQALLSIRSLWGIFMDIVIEDFLASYRMNPIFLVHCMTNSHPCTHSKYLRELWGCHPSPQPQEALSSFVLDICLVLQCKRHLEPQCWDRSWECSLVYLEGWFFSYYDNVFLHYVPFLLWKPRQYSLGERYVFWS